MHFLIRHWRGELPLAQALWLNGVALTAVIIGTANLSLVGRWQSAVDSRPEFFMLTACSAIFLIIIPVWQMRGLWRAADHHMNHVGTILAGRGTQIIATILTLLAVLRVIGAGNDVILLSPAALNTGIYHSQIEVQMQGREIEIRGGFGFGLAERVANILAEQPAIRRVHLDSCGGSLTEAILLARLIESHQLNSYTSEICSNTCVMPFIFGRHRVLKRGCRLAFSNAYGLPQSALEGIQSRNIRGSFIHRWKLFGAQAWYPNERELRFSGVVNTMLGNPSR